MANSRILQAILKTKLAETFFLLKYCRSLQISLGENITQVTKIAYC